MDTLILSKSVFSQIMDTVGKRPPECGGVLGAAEGEIVTEFYFDEQGLSIVVACRMYERCICLP